MGHYLAIKTTPTEFKHFKVPIEVYIYVRQLENALRFGGRVKEAVSNLYPRRFTSDEEEVAEWKHLRK